MQSRDPYIAGLVKNVPPEQQRSVLIREAQRLTGVSQGHDRSINLQRRAGYEDSDPQIQGWLELTRGTDAELQRNQGKPREGTLNDRVQRIQAALGKPAGPVPDVLEPWNRLLGRQVLGGPPRPGAPPSRPKPQVETLGETSKRLLGRDVWSTPAPNELRMREEELEGPQVAQLDPSISFLKKYGPVLGLGGWNAAPEEMLETSELWKQQARAGQVARPPKLKGPDDERMFAQVRDLSTKFYREVILPRSRQRYPETSYQVPGLGKVKGPPLPTSPEPLEAYQDAGLTELYERFPEWLQAQSKVRLPSQVIQFAIALKDLAKLQRQRAGRLAVSTLTDVGVQAGSSALDALTGQVGEGKQLVKMLTKGPKPPLPLPKPDWRQAVGRTVGPKALGGRYVQGVASQAVTDVFARPELSAEERMQRAHESGVGSTLVGTALHGGMEVGGGLWSAGKQFREGRKTGGLQAGDVVRVPRKPELGTATVREVKDGWAVLHLEQSQKGAVTVKVRIAHVEPVQLAGEHPKALPTPEGEASGPRTQGEAEEAPDAAGQTPLDRIRQLPALPPDAPSVVREEAPLRVKLRRALEARAEASPHPQGEGTPHAPTNAQPDVQGEAAKAPRETPTPQAKDEVAVRAGEEPVTPGDAPHRLETGRAEYEPAVATPERRISEEEVPRQESGTRSATPDALELYAARQSGDAEAGARKKRDWGEERHAAAERRLGELEQEGHPRPTRVAEKEGTARTEGPEVRRTPGMDELSRAPGEREAGETVRLPTRRGAAPDTLDQTPLGTTPGGGSAPPGAERAGTPSRDGTTSPAEGGPDKTAAPGEAAKVTPPPLRGSETAPEGTPAAAATPERTPLPPDEHSPASTSITAPETPSGAVVVSGSREGPGSPAARLGPSLADQLAPGHAGVVWHATGATAALELVAGRSNGPGLEVADRLALAKGPGGRSVVLELDPARLQGTAGTARTRPGRKYAVTGVEPEAVRALVLGTQKALAQFAADPAVAARFDFTRPVKTERGWRVERRGSVDAGRPPTAHSALRREVMKQLWRPLTEPELRGQVRRKLPPVGVPEVLAELVHDGAVSVEHRGGETRYRVEPSVSAIEPLGPPAEIKPLDYARQKLRQLQQRGNRDKDLPDIQAAETAAKKNIRGLRHVNYEGIDLDVASALTRTITTISEQYGIDVPAIMPHTWEGWGLRHDTEFMAANHEGIRFNPEMCRGPKKTIFLAVWEKGQYTSKANRGLEAVVAHEMGHVIADSGRTRQGTRLAVLTSRAIVHKHVREFRNEVGQKAVIDELSAYAWYGGGANPSESSESALNETWAQAFSAYHADRNSLSVRTRTMVETVLRDLGMR